MLRSAEKYNSENKYRSISIATISSIAVGIVFILIGMVYYKYFISKLGITDTTNYQEYEYHYAIISEEEDATFWDAICTGALEKGKEQNVYVERIGSNLSITYSLEDLMRIAIASKVDGIILEPNAEEDITSLINEADEAGITVITVLRDAAGSKRKSFIGINSKTQGQVYANEVMEIVKEGKKNITILLNEETTDYSKNMIYSSILEAVSNSNVKVNPITVNSKSDFSSEEEIRKIIVDKENPPDLLVCLTAIDTLGAYQAVVDYNKVGEIDIVGYYDSDIFLSAIDKNIIHSTMTIDANQMGAYCVEALTEYRETNHVNDYYPVDISVIDKNNIKDYIKIENADKTE